MKKLFALFLAASSCLQAQQTTVLVDATTGELKRPTVSLFLSGNPSIAAGGGTWGSITGTLSAQTDLQAALDLKAALANPTFTGTVTIPTPFTLGAVSVLPTGTELNFVDGVTSAIQTQLNAKQATITFGTGVQTALGVNVGSAGAPVLFNGAGGTPSSITLTNASGTAASLTAGNVTTNANLTGHITSTGNAAVLGSFSFTQLNTALTGDDAAGLATNNALTGRNTTALGFEHAWTSQSTGAQNYAINSRYYISTFTTSSTATFTGTPVNGSTVIVKLDNCDGVATFTYPSAIRLPGTTASTVITPTAGDHLFRFEYSNSVWSLTDTVPPVTYASDAGGDDTYAFTVPNYTAYTTGDSFTLTVATANTGAATANINAIGAVTLKKAASGAITTDLATGDLLAGQTFTVAYDGTNFLITSPLAAGAGGSGDVVGPASATDNAVARYDSTTGELLQDSSVIISDNGDVDVPSTATLGARLFNTVDKVTNYERGEFLFSSNVFTIRTLSGGTGVSRNLNIIANGSGAGILLKGSAATSGVAVITLPNSNVASSIGLSMGLGNQTQTSGTSYGVRQSYTINQASGTASQTDYSIIRTETALGSGDQNFVNFETAALGSMFRVTNRGKMVMYSTVTTGGTTGNQTIDKPTGTVNIAAAGTTVTVTNALCTTSSIVLCNLRTNDTTAYIKNCVPGSGSFVITLGAAATAEVSIGFVVIN